MLYSYSRLKKYEDCPAWWFRSYVLNQKEPPTEALELGRAVHKTLEIILKSGVTNRYDPALETVMNKAIQEALSEASLPLDAEEIHRLVYQPGVLEYLGTWFVEDHFQIPLNGAGIELQGYIDLWQYDGENPVIIDWKTNRLMYEPTDNYQLGLYALAMAEKVNRVEKRWPESIRAQLVFLRHGCQFREHVYTREEMKAARDWAVKIATEIEGKLLEHALDGDPKNLFPAIPSDTCRWCPWASECLKSSEAFGEINTVTTQAEAKALAAECIRLEEALDQMKKALRAWVETNGPVVVGNQSYELRPTTYWRFDPEALKRAIGAIKQQGKDPLWYLTIDNYNINRLKWNEDDLLGFGATSKTYHSLRRVKAKQD